jgi:hypothetical protein
MPSNDEYYYNNNNNNNNNESRSPFSLNQLSRKLYRDYDYDDDPNSSSRGGGGPSSSRFQGRNINNNNNNKFGPPQRSSESSRYRDYDDVNYAYTRSYRNDNEQDGGNDARPPRPESQYRDYDDINYAPSRSYRREEGSINGNSRTVDDDNNRSKYTKFPPPPPPPPPPPRRRRPQSIPNNFAPPQSNRSDSPRINFPPGVGGSMGYTPPSEYIPQQNNNNNGRVGGGGRSSRTPPPPRPPPQRPSRPPQPRYNNNNKRKYQYDINRQERYIDDDVLRRSQTQYNFPNGETIRNERINTLRPVGFNSIFSDMFTPFTQMFRSASQSLQSSDMLKEARLRIVEDEVIRTKLGEPLEVSPPFSQSSSMSSVSITTNNGRQNENKASTKVRARFQVGGPYGTGVATMDSVDGMIRSLVVDVNGVTVRIGPRQKKNGSSRNGNRRKNVVEAEILDD